MLKITSVIVAASLASVAQAGISGNSQFYDDVQNDLFDADLGNLDILSGQVSDDGTNITFLVETRDYAIWTKFMLFIDVRAGGTSSNGWGRPVNLTSDIDYFVGSWIDQTSNNSQYWGYSGGQWNLDATFTNFVTTGSSTGGNTVSWTIPLGVLGLSGGETIYFDIATSAANGSDPGVDHLSRQTIATPGWGTASTSGTFLEYQVSGGVPAPGAIALLGLAGLAGRRRR